MKKAHTKHKKYAIQTQPYAANEKTKQNLKKKSAEEVINLCLMGLVQVFAYFSSLLETNLLNK